MQNSTRSLWLWFIRRLNEFLSANENITLESGNLWGDRKIGKYYCLHPWKRKNNRKKDSSMISFRCFVSLNSLKWKEKHRAELFVRQMEFKWNAMRDFKSAEKGEGWSGFSKSHSKLFRKCKYFYYLPFIAGENLQRFGIGSLFCEFVTLSRLDTKVLPIIGSRSG